MSIIKNIEADITKTIQNLGYNITKVNLQPSGRPELGEFQINDAFNLAKEAHCNPREVAQKIVDELEKDDRFTNLNIAGPGFINLSFTEKFHVEILKQLSISPENNIDQEPKKKVIIDYGGANAAKALHVGHMRSANIGEALRRLAVLLGNDVISDVHLGDMGRQSGMVISELKIEQPDLPWFDPNYTGDYPEISLTNDDLGRLYPAASTKAKSDENRMEEVREITAKIDKGDAVLTDLWKKIVDVSSEGIKKTYDRLNCHFDLWEGEMDACNYKNQVLDIFKDHLYESNGALVIDVQKEDDKKEYAPLIVIKSDGATIYATRDLGSLYSRIERFHPDEVWYVTDERQSLYFEQVFRAAYKTGLVPSTTMLGHYWFGTINGNDGKPFKTRDGGVMQLDTLLDIVKESVTSRMREDIVGEERDKIAEELTIATLKYADLLPFRGTDYIFDVEKFADLEGKTGPYLLYSTIRMRSLLNKAKIQGYATYKIHKLKEETDKDILLLLLNLPRVLKKSYDVKSLNDIAEYLFKLTSTYNKFYSENHILTSEDEELKTSWLALTEVVYKTNLLLLNVLGISVPEKNVKKMLRFSLNNDISLVDNF